jgi:class 3 adenylate cyclase
LQIRSGAGETLRSSPNRTARCDEDRLANDRIRREELLHLDTACGAPRNRPRRPLSELAYRFELDLQSPPERLWPLVSDTNRFNRDAGIPPVERRGNGLNARRRLRLSTLGVALEWEEEPFEWVSPHRFSVRRRYVSGPIDSMTTTLELAPRSDGTRLTYDVQTRPRNLLGRLAIPIVIGVVSRRRFSRTFRSYDSSLANEESPAPRSPGLSSGGEARLRAARQALIEAGQDAELVGRLIELVRQDDDLVLQRIRPFALARQWGVERRPALELCLEATRQGVLELRWELLCPLCRGPSVVADSLGETTRETHCDTCLIDFAADFDRSVEVTFRPTPLVREVGAADYCVAGPQITPHVVAQQLVQPGDRRVLRPLLEPGRYRLRALAVSGALPIEVTRGGAAEEAARLGPDGWPNHALELAEKSSLELANDSKDERLLVLERTAWSDDAATAAEVTSLQAFRDLFAREALRPGEPIAVGSPTVVFTDLRGSTGYYREVGDAPAFGSVLEHLDVLRSEVAAEGGAVVKSMGDAIMAVFARPVCAVRAMLAAQRAVAGRPLTLKVGIHSGPCIAVNQNGVLDYFGSTVNLAARLVGLSSGDDLVVSDATLGDPEVAALDLAAEPVEGTVKGFEGETLSLWRVRT